MDAVQQQLEMLTLDTMENSFPVPLQTTLPIATIFDIHLLQARICSHLDSRSLRHCALVSREFYHAFNPFLWKTILIHRKATYNRFLRPEAQAALTRFATHVTHVSSNFASIWREFLTQQCRNLVFIASPCLHHRRHQHKELHQAHLPVLIELCRVSSKLETLKVGLSRDTRGNGEVMRSLCQVLRHHPSLKHLIIDPYYNPLFFYDVHDLLWVATFKLDRLSMNWSPSKYPPAAFSEEDTRTMARMRTATAATTMTTSPSNREEGELGNEMSTEEPPPLSSALRWIDLAYVFINHERERTFKYISQCPNLEWLSVPASYPEWASTEFAPVIRNHLPYLRHLHLQGYGVDRHENQDRVGLAASVLIKSCQPHQLLSFSARFVQEGPEPVVTALLESHKESLESCRIYCSTDSLKSESIQGLLTSCPRLEVLELMCPNQAPWYTREDLRLSELIQLQERKRDPFLDINELTRTRPGFVPWVCKNLKVLKVKYTAIRRASVSVSASTSTSEELEEEDSDEILPKILYEQLGELTCLEDLRLGLAATSLKEILVDLEDLKVETTAGWSLAAARANSLFETRQQNVRDALQAFTHLTRLQKLELRGLGPFIIRKELNRLRRDHWKDMQWIQYS
ncbi:hypothetical protein BGZ83_000530 [Gryganskiella cystojenkinii]|nr:hypothetical protein BGZ83_000530 [Gryganskiella cystojenkinii]